MNTLQDRIRGSLIGGAIGDALGYPVEFIYSFGEIQKRYGERGITRLDSSQHWLDEIEQVGKAVVSDDTQMTLFTACGMLNAGTFEDAKYSICEAYLEWFLTQTQKKKKNFNQCWIKKVPELNERRAPGHTCLSALNDIFNGRESFNNSKGCGGIMRTAPIALYSAVWSDDAMTNCRNNYVKDVMKLSAEAADITHHHVLGWLPSALEAYIIYELMHVDTPTAEDVKSFINEGFKLMYEIYPNLQDDVSYLEHLVTKAIDLVDSPFSDHENIEAIGGGWVGDEALAMSIYCTIKYFDDYEKAMIAAVNHAGDSDSIGAITGNILGTAIGYEAIPQFFKDDLELHDVILHVADDLWRGETTKYERNKR